MIELQQIKAQVLADGAVSDSDVDTICEALYPQARIDQEIVEFLLSIRREANEVCSTFDSLLCDVVKHYVLTRGFIDSEQAAWIERIFLADGNITSREKQLLWDLKRAASGVSREFQDLYDARM